MQVMKMDVEGYEPFVLHGAERLFTEHRVWFVATELSPMLLCSAAGNQAQDAAADFLQHLLRQVTFTLGRCYC